MPGSARRMRSSQIESAQSDRHGEHAAGADEERPTRSSTPATTRARDSPSARSAAISPSRWFTDTVSSTAISRNPKNSVTVASTDEICRK